MRFAVLQPDGDDDVLLEFMAAAMRRVAVQIRALLASYSVTSPTRSRFRRTRSGIARGAGSRWSLPPHRPSRLLSTNDRAARTNAKSRYLPSSDPRQQRILGLVEDPLLESARSAAAEEVAGYLYEISRRFTKNWELTKSRKSLSIDENHHKLFGIKRLWECPSIGMTNEVFPLTLDDRRILSMRRIGPMARSIQTDRSTAAGWAKTLPGSMKNKLGLVSNMNLAMANALAALGGSLQ